ncbi:MAG: response regulator transcription factor [Flavobacteriaceae bacterium]
MTIRCLLIDDEPTSQSVLKNFVSMVDYLEVVAVCSNAVEGMTVLKKEAIDLIFLDVNMPKISGLSFYKSLQNPPLVIFTTAYSEHAIEAFNVSAVDYLLKPFSFDRFLTATNKALDSLTISESSTKSPSILVKADKKLHKIATSTISHIEACGDYVKIYTDDRFIMTNNTFKNILNSLPDNFIQVHKSFAINLQKAGAVEGNQILIGSYKVPVGLTYKSSFLERFKKE